MPMNEEMPPTERCCCCHARTCTWMLCLLEIVIAIIGIIQAIAVLFMLKPLVKFLHVGAALWGQVVLLVVWLIVTFLVLVSLCKSIQKGFIPHMVTTCLVIVAMIYLAVLSAGRWEQLLLFNPFIYLTICLILIFCLVSEYRCYKWLTVYRHVRYFILYAAAALLSSSSFSCCWSH